MGTRVRPTRTSGRPRAPDEPTLTRGLGSWWTARAPRLSLAALPLTVGAALAVKLGVLAALGEHPLLQPLGELDTAAYVDLAGRMAAQGPLSVAEPLAVSPLYVFFLAGAFAVAGRSLLAARLIQVVLGTAAVALIWLTTARWFDRRVAGFAAATAVMTGFFTFSEVVILQSALDPFLTALALWAATWAVQATSAWPAMAAGASAGLLALNRPNALVWALVLPFLVAAGHSRVPAPAPAARRPSRRLVSALLATAGLALVVAPNAWRNHAVSGEWIPISSHGGFNLLIGNGPGATGTYRPIEGITPSIAGQDRDATRVAEAALGRRLSAAEVSAYFARRALEWMTGHPTEAAALVARKVLLLLNRTDVPLNFSYAYFQQDEPSLLRLLVVGPWLLVPLGLTGLCLGRQWSHPGTQAARAAPPVRGWQEVTRPDHPPNYWAWAAFVPVYAASVVVFFVADRYRVPLLVPLCVGTGVAVIWIQERCRTRLAGSTILPLGAMAALAVISHLNLGLDDGRGGEQIRKAVWLIIGGRSARLASMSNGSRRFTHIRVSCASGWRLRWPRQDSSTRQPRAFKRHARSTATARPSGSAWARRCSLAGMERTPSNISKRLSGPSTVSIAPPSASCALWPPPAGQMRFLVSSRRCPACRRSGPSASRSNWEPLRWNSARRPWPNPGYVQPWMAWNAQPPPLSHPAPCPLVTCPLPMKSGS